MRIKQESFGYWRIFKSYAEIAYVKFGLSGLQLEFELPTTWHEEKRAWFRFGFGLGKIAFSIPWHKTYPDYYQCQGPTYGFQFFDDILFLNWGQSTGNSKDRRTSKSFYMPWSWRHQKHEILSEPQTFAYHYKLNSGELQYRTATIQKERRTWKRFWLPYKFVRTSIDVNFNKEVGERSGSWKGGTIGCSYDMLPGEAPYNTLMRMMRDQKF